jgi:capsular exopolysaccharide synthesis family protein
MFDKHRLSLLLFRFWWLILLCVIIAMLGSFSWAQRQLPVYTTKAVVEVAQQEERIVNVQSVKSENPGGMDYILTVAESLKADAVLLGAAKNSDLYEELRRSGMADAAIVKLLAAKVTTLWRKGTRLIDVVATDVDPARAAKLSNSVVEQYLALATLNRSTISGEATEYLKEQAKRIDEELAKAHTDVAEFRLKHKNLPLDEASGSSVERSTELSARLLDAKSLHASLVADVERARAIRPEDYDALLKISSLATIPAVDAARTALATREQEFELLKRRYLELHPKYIRAMENIEIARSGLRRLLGDAAPLLEERAAQTASNVKNLEEAVAAMGQESSSLNGILIPYQELRQKAETLQKRYDEITGRIADIGMKEKRADRVPVYLAAAAMVPSVPDRVSTPALLLRAAVGGVLLGLGIIFLIDRLDQTYQSVEHVEAEMGVPVLSAIPDDTLEKRKLGGLPLVSDRQSIQAEAYRTLRATLSLLGDESRRKVFLVTSAVPGEGKSRTSGNLSVAFAQRGLKTLLIDADMRRPSQQNLFSNDLRPTEAAIAATLREDGTGKAGKLAGLSEYLSGLAQLSDVCQATTVENLTVMLAGGRCPQPADLLAQKAFTDLLARAEQLYDRIIIDTPPVNSVADALVMAPSAHAVCLVVHSGSTSRRAVQRAIESLRRAKGNTVGVILNRQRAGVYGYYYNYRYDPYVKAKKA